MAADLKSVEDQTLGGSIPPFSAVGKESKMAAGTGGNSSIETEKEIRAKCPDFPFAAAPTEKELQQERAREKAKLASGRTRRRAPSWMKPPR